MNLTIAEQETIVNLERDKDYMEIYTSDSTMITKLSKLLEAESTEWILISKTDYDMKVKAPKNLLSLRTKTIKRDLTDEQRKELAERMRNLNKS